MLKLVVFACLCAAVLVESQDPTPPQPPPAPTSVAVEEAEHSRVVRQAQIPSMPQMPGGNDRKDNLATNFGNPADPTAWVAKGQEVASQMASGRRRRQAGPPPDSTTPAAFN